MELSRKSFDQHRKIRVLLSGPGLIGKKHAELLDKSSRSILAAVVAPPTSINLAFASARSLPLFASMQQAVASVPVDAAILASPNIFHAEQALFCIERRIPVLVEKPLAADLESAVAICRRAKAEKVPVLVGHHRTYSGLLKIAKKFVSSSKFGELAAVQGSALFRKPEHYFEEGPWRARAGGGPILINLIHDIGILRSLCGPIYSVSAMAGHARRRFEVEDTVAILMRFANGALGTFILSDIAASDRSWEFASGENQAYPHSPDAVCYHIAGTNGSLDFPTLQVRFYGSEQTPSWWNAFRQERLAAERTDPLERRLAHFEAVVANEAEPLVSAEEGLENMRVLEAIQRAIASEGTINLGNGA